MLEEVKQANKQGGQLSYMTGMGDCSIRVVD